MGMRTNVGTGGNLQATVSLKRFMGDMTDDVIWWASTVSLTSAAAATPVSVFADSSVPPGFKCFVTGYQLVVNGATAWTDSTGTKVIIADTNASPVEFAEIAKAALTANAYIGPFTASSTPQAAMKLNTGGTVGNGVQLVADHTFAAGSPLVLTVYGYCAKQSTV